MSRIISNGRGIPSRDLFKYYLARIESRGGNVANGDGYNADTHTVITTGEMPTPWGELVKQTKIIGLPVIVIDSYSDRRTAYAALEQLEQNL